MLTDLSFATSDDLPLDGIRDALSWNPGTRLDEHEIQRGLARLGALPFLVPSQRTDLELEPRPDGVRATLRLARRDVVHDLSFHGLLPIFDREARSALRMRIGDPFDPADLPNETTRLEKLAARNGFSSTSCKVKQEPAEHHSVDLIYRCWRGRWLTVRNVDVEGATAVPPSEVAFLMRPWFFFTQDDFEQRLMRVRDRFRRAGYVRARIVKKEIHPDPETGNVDVVIGIEQQKQLVVHFDGNQALTADDLDDELPFRREGGYGTFLVDEGAEAIRKAYQRAGYPDASVTSERTEGPDRVEVRYHVTEGEPRSLSTVRFNGNASVSPRKLRALLQSRNRRWLVLAPRLQDDVLESDRATIEDHYRELGFVNAHVAFPEHHSVDGHVEALFTIDEGAKASVTRVELEDIPASVAALVPKEAPVAVGDPYVAQRVETWREELEKAFQTDGHLRAVVGVVEDWSEAMDSVGLRVTGYPGPQFLVGTVFTVGGENVRQDLLDRSTYLKRGRELSPEAIVHTHEDLRELDVFESIRIRPIGLGNARFAGGGHDAGAEQQPPAADGTVTPGAEPPEPGGEPAATSAAAPAAPSPAATPPNSTTPKQEPPEKREEDAGSDGGRTVPVVIELREQPRIRFDVGPSYDTDRGAAAHVTLETINLLDRAVTLHTDGTYGEKDREASVTLSEPRLLDQHVRGSLLVSWKDQDFPAFDRREFDSGVELKRELVPKLVGTVGLDYKISDITNVTSFDPEAPRAGISHELVWSTGVAWDSRNDLLYPSSGDYLAGSIGIAARTLVSDDNFVRLDAQARHYHILADHLVGVLSARITDVALYGSTRDVPTPELLFAGGASSVRGFEEDRLGPLDDHGRPLGGGSRLVASAELRFPLVAILEGAVFTDAGSVTTDISSLFGHLEPTAGVGVRARTPVGPVRLDVGYQLEPNPPLARWALHFSFGYPF